MTNCHSGQQLLANYLLILQSELNYNLALFINWDEQIKLQFIVIY